MQDGWEVVESAPKTDSGERIISLDEYTVEVLEAHRVKQGAELYQSVMPKAARDAAEATAAMVPRGAVRRPVQVAAPAEDAVEVTPAPAQQDGHAMGTQEGAKIIAFRPRLVRA
ncbi:hypothetical protein [Streptomyces sp. NBC_01408]|uniref:hypothetical protein n=1 Tax=Streptomyces sp. NBC_01408 TaxID=2903855 RepID=UPI00224FEC60|nr:hypothetical protein [Streptomyces sp. NBC_01408]MCX4692530.1 hypothetical protein [Streptomyces sp. NBC_01408]